MELYKFFPLTGLIVIITLLAGRIIYLKKKGVNVTSGKTDNSIITIFLYILSGIVLLLWISELVILAFHLPVPLLPSRFTEKIVTMKFLIITGSLMIVTSIILFMVTLSHFKESLRFGLNGNNQGQLITNGVFSLSRNPFFLSVDIYFTGLALLHPSLFFITMALLTLISIHLFILKEERFLQKYYGQKYSQYTSRVRRYL
jgi:protein-S-isoprenylcysteine O-methyltransferase Ste14